MGEGKTLPFDFRPVPHTKHATKMPSTTDQNPPALRVSIIGATGAGKTLLARRLARVLPARVVHMDSHIWGPGWTLRDRAVAEAELQAVLRTEPAWIAEGHLEHAAREMLELADLVIYLDLSRPRLLRNIVLRWWRHRRRRRPELPEGCEERLGFARLRLTPPTTCTGSPRRPWSRTRPAGWCVSVRRGN
jgi:adenylate kinase family enzyme